MPDRSCSVGVDWGSSGLRAWLLDPHGSLVDSLETDEGVLFDRADALRERLTTRLRPWFESHPVGVAVGIGVLGSRSGIVDAGYLSAPVTWARWAREAVPAGRLKDVPLVILPGVRSDAPDGAPVDVMRGEEFHVFAARLAGAPEGAFVCPGTHSKWVSTEGDAIVGLRTYVTGELFRTWSRASSLTELLTGDDDPAGFADGLALAAEVDDTLAGLFRLRAGIVAGATEPRRAREALSGFLIGRETRHALRDVPGGRVTVLADGPIGERYLAAVAAAGGSARLHSVDAPSTFQRLYDERTKTSEVRS